MPAKHLNTDEFFTRLSALFDSRRNSTHGSVFLTQKRLSPLESHPSSPTNPAIPFADLAPSSPLPILIRASNGKSKERRADKVKLSTIVRPEELDTFFARYAEVIRAGTTALKKRDRSGRKKATKAKRKGKGGGGVGGEGEKK